MFKFAKEQIINDINGKVIGGQPGERPTTLVGSIFFRGHKIVSDTKRGIFDKDKARALLMKEAEVAEETGNPNIIDVIGDTGEALIRFIEFVALHSDAPILVDSVSASARMAAIRHFASSEVMPRLIYNSIDEHHTEEELTSIRECGVKNAVLLAFSSKYLKPQAKVKLLSEDLLIAAGEAGIENVLVDTGVLDIPSVGWSTDAIRLIKDQLGYPCGCAPCAPSNALYQWDRLREKGMPAFESASSVTFTLPIAFGADFIFYGPIRNAPWAYSACATMDAMVAFAGRNHGIRPVNHEHPLYRIF
jgi:tetrahydromethanopterin S-methyltransferase subunit H